MKTITMFYATDIKAKCPYCDQWFDGWLGDPRGSKTTCDYCSKEIEIHKDADVEFYF